MQIDVRTFETDEVREVRALRRAQVRDFVNRPRTPAERDKLLDALIALVVELMETVELKRPE